MQKPQRTVHPRSEFVIRTLIVVGILSLTALVWVLSDILLLLFGAILIAVVLRALADPIATRFGTGDGVALSLAGALVIGLVALAVLLAGPEVVEQMRELLDRLPGAYNDLSSRFQLGSFTDLFKESGSASSLGTLAMRLASWGSMAVGVLASLAVVIFGGLYLAANPRAYLDGFIKMVPPHLQPTARATLDDCGEALRRWLTGQLVAMLLVGALTGVGLWLVGVPSPIALGLITGLAEFVPIFGPFVSIVPIAIMASAQGFETVAWALGVFVVVQQIESNLIAPMIAEKTVAVAPALGLFAVVAMGVVFGPLGLLLGYPLVVVADVCVRRLYIHDTLREPVEILGRDVAAPAKE